MTGFQLTRVHVAVYLFFLASATGALVAQDPDLTATKTNDTGGMGTVGTPFNWSIRIDNIGAGQYFGSATFDFFSDQLPDTNMTYGTPSISSQSGFTGTLDCSIVSGTRLRCFTNSNVTLNAGGHLTVTVQATPTSAGVFDNPRSGGTCRADSGNLDVETNEGNNDCSDSVTVTTGAVGPDMTVSKTNNTGGVREVGQGDFNWAWAVANGGSMSATFNSGETILSDNLPNSNVSYGTPSVGSESGISGTGMISCSVVSFDLTCTANGGTVTLAAGSGAFTVTLATTPTAAGTLANPRAGGSCSVDPSDTISEGDETNNACSDSVTINPSPDLTATKSNNTGGVATVGVPFNWIIRIDNVGAAQYFGSATFSFFRDNLPDANMTYGTPTISSSSGFTGMLNCTVNGSALLDCFTNSNITLDAGGHVEITVAATPTAAGTFDNPRSGGSCKADFGSLDAESDETNNDCNMDSVVASTPVVGPDVGIVKSNDVGGAIELAEVSWDWSLQVTAGGNMDATFASGQTIISDNLPNSNISYGAVTVGSMAGISGTGMVTCSIVTSNLTCTATGGTVTLASGSGTFTASFTATPTTAGVFGNPRGGGICAVDPNDDISEGDEGNNTCSDSVTVTNSPDLVATKTNDTAGVGALSTPFNWTVRIDNVGGGQYFGQATFDFFRDSLPDTNMTYGTPSISSQSGFSGTLNCTIIPTAVLRCSTNTNITLDAGGHVEITVAATPTADGTFDNPRSGGSCLADFGNLDLELNEGNNACSNTVTVPPPLPDLTATKSNDVAGTTEIASGAWNWSVQVDNGGGTDATFNDTEVILSDNLPTNATYGTPSVGSVTNVTNSGNISCSIVSSNLTCSASGAAVTLGSLTGSFTVSFSATPSAAGTFDNPRSGGACSVDPNSLISEAQEGNNACSDSVTVNPSPDLTIVKSNSVMGTGSLNVAFDWTLTVSNAGATANFSSGEVIVSDNLPDSDMTFGSPSVVSPSGLGGTGTASCTILSANLTCTASGGNVTISAGGGFGVQFSATPTATGTFDNPRSGGACQVDPNNLDQESDEGNNQCADSVTVPSLPDLTVAKSNDVAGSTEVAAGAWDWSLVLTNGGVLDATFSDGQVILRDELPSSGLTYGSPSVGGEAGISGTGTIACAVSVADLTCSASGGTVAIAAGTGTFTATVSATPTAAGSFDNPRAAGVCGADPDGHITEQNEGNNSCADSVSVAASPDLTVVKSNSVSGTGNLSVPFDWTLAVSNADATASFPSGAVIVSDNLPDSGMTFGSPSVTSPSGISGGGSISCTILSANLECTASGGNVDIAAGGGFNVEFSATPTTTGVFDNPRSGGACQVDPSDADAESNEGNNACSDSVTVPTQPDLTAVKTNDAGGPVEVVEDWNWSIVVSNSGGTAAANFSSGQVILRDELPSGLVFGTPSVGSQTDISGAGSIDCAIASSVLTCSAAGGDVVMAAASGEFTVTFNVQPGIDGTFDNPGAGVCAADPDSLLNEHVESNNDCSDSVTVIPSPDIFASKSNDAAGNGAVGVPFTWSVNVASADAEALFPDGSVILTDNLPDSGAVYGSASIGASSGISGTVDCQVSGSDLTCTASGGSVAISDGGSFTVDVVVTPTTPGMLDNPRAGGICQADPNDVDEEPDNANNSCSDSVMIEGPDLTAVKSNDIAGSGSVGSTFGWRIEVVNGGAGTADFAEGAAIVRDDLPAGAAYGVFSASALSGIGGAGTLTCGEAGQVLTCTAVGGAVSIASGGGFSVSGSVTPVLPGTLDNPAAAGICAVDPDASVLESLEDNNACSDSVTVAGPDLETTKTNDAAGMGFNGIPFQWTIRVDNVGTGAAEFTSGQTILLDDLPAEADYSAFAVGMVNSVTGAADLGCSLASNVVSCIATGTVSIAGGGSFEVSFTATPTAAGALTNPAGAALTAAGAIVARVGGGGICAADPNNVVVEEDETDNACSDMVVVSAPDLVLTKTTNASLVGVGEVVIYTLGYSNQGSLEATGVVLNETIPGSTAFVAADSTPGWSCAPNEQAGSNCQLSVGTLLPGANGSAQFAVRLLESPPSGTILNTASIEDDGNNGADANSASNTGEASISTAPTIPTLGFWGIVILGGLLAGAAWRRLRR